MGADIAVGGV
jgi:glycine dehydrogenase